MNLVGFFPMMTWLENPKLGCPKIAGNLSRPPYRGVVFRWGLQGACVLFFFSVERKFTEVLGVDSYTWNHFFRQLDCWF